MSYSLTVFKEVVAYHFETHITTYECQLIRSILLLITLTFDWIASNTALMPIDVGLYRKAES